MKIVFASNNIHKLSEIRNIIGDKIVVCGLEESGYRGEIPEDFETLEKNSSQKAWFVYNQLDKDCFADDTGLEVEALGGEPGVFSARYSRTGDMSFGNGDIIEDNIRKLLHNMRSIQNRKARFRTVISLILEGTEYQFEGIINGVILHEKWGDDGFGYDPVFMPEGYSKSFAQMSLKEKNEISHRAIAIKNLRKFLNEL